MDPRSSCPAHFVQDFKGTLETSMKNFFAASFNLIPVKHKIAKNP